VVIQLITILTAIQIQLLLKILLLLSIIFDKFILTFTRGTVILVKMSTPIPVSITSFMISIFACKLFFTSQVAAWTTSHGWFGLFLLLALGA
jgi:hypothetical protein